MSNYTKDQFCEAGDLSDQVSPCHRINCALPLPRFGQFGRFSPLSSSLPISAKLTLRQFRTVKDMRRLMIILTCQLLIRVTWGRPQSPNTKIIFGTDDDIHGLRHDDCDHEKGMIYWLEDGQCYDIGER